MTTTERMSVEQRLGRLERQNRNLRRVLVLALAAAPLVAAVESGKVPKVLETEKLVVRDAKGASRAELAPQADGSVVLAFSGAHGSTTVALRGAAAGPILELADGSGGSVWLSSSTTGSSLSLGKGKGEIEIAVRATGEPTVKLQNKEGKIVWTAP